MAANLVYSAELFTLCSVRDFRFINWRHCIIKDMDLRPLHDRVLVKRLDEGEQKQGGIIIPDTAKEKPQQAEVKAVGSGKLLDSGERTPVDVKPGDRILFAKYSGADIKVDGDEYLILREDEILGILE
jgi:chaperonin GroES